MSTGYSLRIRDLNAEADADKIGVRLGRECIAHDIPVAAVARHMKVSRVTVYNWFTGQVDPHPTAVAQIQKYLAHFE